MSADKKGLQVKAFFVGACVMSLDKQKVNLLGEENSACCIDCKVLIFGSQQSFEIAA